MDYIGIIKRAYEITIKHKYLWIFGVFAGGFGGSMRGFNIELPRTQENGSIDKFLTSNMNFSWQEFFSRYWGVILSAAIILFLILVGWWVFSIISQGAILGSVEAIDKKKENNFKLGAIYGWHKFWKVFGASILLALIIIISIIILALPIVTLAIAHIYIFAIIYGILMFFIMLFFWIILGFIYPYILRLIVLDNKGVIEGFHLSWPLFKKNWKEIIIMYLLLFAVGIAVGIGLLLIILVVGGLLLLIGIGIFLASKTGGYIYSAIGLSIFGILMLVISGAINSFNSTALTLTYLELDKKD